MALDVREYENSYANYIDRSNNLVITDGKLSESFKNQVRNFRNELILKLENEIELSKDFKDYSVYTGTAGYSLLFMRLSESGDEAYLKSAQLYCAKSTVKLKGGRRVSFLCGDAGPLAISAVLHHKLGKAAKTRDFIEKLEVLHGRVINEAEMPDELLYGRTGYLYALLYIRDNIDEAAVKPEIITRVIDAILKSGRELAAQVNIANCPLYYVWHDKAYIGAAHGLIGILYILLQARSNISDENVKNLVKPTIDFVLSLSYKSGNFPSSLGIPADKLIHWCHGAPGAVHLFALAYRVFGDEIYLNASKKCADVIWSRGLLKKGCSMCHGVSGNGYAFLKMFQLTKEVKYLYQAAKFAEWCFSNAFRGCVKPDRPLSLFEGLAGIIYFLTDLLDSENAAFPAFQLKS